MRVPLGFVFTVSGGCFHVSSVPSCEESVTSVADDEPTPFGTAAELLARIVGVHEAAGSLDDGTPVVATLEVERGEGTAEQVDVEEIELRTRSFGFGHTTWTGEVDCDVDRLRVPTVAGLTTDEGSVDVVFEGSAWTGGSDDGGSEYDAIVEAEVPFPSSGLPLPTGVDLSEWSTQSARLHAAWDANGSTVGHAGWNGRTENAVAVESLVTWSTEDLE